MKILFKNSSMVTMDDVIKKGLNAGGIPSSIEMLPVEAIKFLDELQVLDETEEGKKLLKDTFSIITRHHEQIPSIIRVGKLISEFGSKRVMEMWKDGEYELKYKNIPLNIIDRRS